METQIWNLPALWMRMAAQKRNSGLCQHFCLGESFPCSPSPNARQFSSSPYSLVPFQLLPQCWSLERVKSKSMCGPFKGSTWDSGSSPSHSATIPASVYMQMLWGFSSWHWNPGLAWGGARTPSFLADTSPTKITLPVFICHARVWVQLIPHLCPSCQSGWSFFIFLVLGLLVS